MNEAQSHASLVLLAVVGVPWLIVSGSQYVVNETYYDLPAGAWVTLTANGWTPWQPKHWKRRP